MKIKAVFIPKQNSEKYLKLIVPLIKKNTLPLKIIEDGEKVKRFPEYHKKYGDLFFCLEGMVGFLCNGAIQIK